MPEVQQRKQPRVARTGNWAALFSRNVSILRRAETLSVEQLLASRRKSLARFVRHARATVPFYHDRLDQLFKPDATKPLMVF